MKQEASDLERQIDSLNEEMSQMEKENKNEMDLLVSEKNSELSDLKDQLKDAVMEGSSLRMRCETAETNYEKEQSYSHRLSTQLETANSSLSSLQSEHKKLNELHMKNERKLEKENEKNQKLETNMNEVVEGRVGDIIAQHDAMKKERDEVLEQFADKDKSIEKMKAVVGKKKEEHEKMSHDLEDAKNDYNRANYRIKTLEKKLQSSKA